MQQETMHKVDFVVPLSGSKLFDMHAYVLAQELCEKFPGLEFAMDEKKITITGELNDYRYEEWTKTLEKGAKISL